MRKTKIVCTFLLLTAATACVKKADIEAERAAIRATDAAWASAAAAKNAEEAASFLADDATMMPSHEPAMVGKDAIAQWMAQTLSNPGFSISWQTTAVDVAASGDFAYSIGTNEVQIQMPDGSTMSDKGKALTIWKKQTDGSWKAVVDIFNSDTPIISPAASDTTGAARQ